MADKKITLHPKSTDGQIVQGDNIYPKTTIDQVYSPDGVTPYGPDSFQKPIFAGDGINISEQNVISINFLGTAFKSILLETLYPVNSIYVCTELAEGHTECPIKETLGGEWEKIEGTFLYAAEATGTYTVKQSGGSKDAYLVSHNHEITERTATTNGKAITGTITVGKMPAGIAGSGSSDVTYLVEQDPYSGRTKDYSVTNDKHTHTLTIPFWRTESRGGDATDKNMPPYLCVHMWKRTA